MARPLRIEYPGALYHVTSRGNARRKIFKDDTDREYFLTVLELVLRRYNWICHGYCLMYNHYHLLLETPEGNLSRGMRHLNGVYTQAYNRRHNKTGHIFQGRYKAILVEKEGYLLELCRYVALNPVRARAVAKPQEWKWSSYGATAGMKKIPTYLTVDWILGQFDKGRKESEKRYREFVLAGIKEKSPWRELKGQILLGGEGFTEKFKALLTKKEDIKEIPRIQRHAGRQRIADLFNKEKKVTRKVRNKRIYNAHIRYGYTLKEIAEYLGVHYTTVSKAVKETEDKI
jgi:REP element-mobilizing transposase RayT